MVQSIHMQATKRIEHFQANFTVTTQVTPPEGGHVEGGGSYHSGAIATLMAVPTQGWAFDSWREGESIIAKTPTLRLSVIRNHNIVASFKDPSQLSMLAAAGLFAGYALGGGLTYYPFGERGQHGGIVLDKDGLFVSGMWNKMSLAEPGGFEGFVFDSTYGESAYAAIQRRTLWRATKRWLREIEAAAGEAFSRQFVPIVAGLLSKTLNVYMRIESGRAYWTFKLTDIVPRKAGETAFELDYSAIEAKVSASTRDLISSWARRMESLVSSTVLNEAISIVSQVSPMFVLTAEERMEIAEEYKREIESPPLDQEAESTLKRLRLTLPTKYIEETALYVNATIIAIQKEILAPQLTNVIPPSVTLEWTDGTTRKQAKFARSQFGDRELYVGQVLPITFTGDPKVVETPLDWAAGRESVMELSHTPFEIATEQPWITNIKAFAPLYGGTYISSPVTRDPSPAMITLFEELAKGDGLSLDALGPAQKTELRDFLLKLQGYYDQQAILEHNKMLIGLKPDWAQARVPLFQWRLLKTKVFAPLMHALLPEGANEDHVRNMEILTDTFIKPSMKQYIQTGLMGHDEHAGAAPILTIYTLQMWQDLAAEEFRLRTPEIQTRVRNSRYLSSSDRKMWADVIKLYAASEVNSWLMQKSARSVAEREINTLMADLRTTIEREIETAFLRAEEEVHAMILYTDVMDRVATTVTPTYSPHSRFVWRPRIGHAVEEETHYWEESIHSGLSATLHEIVEKVDVGDLRSAKAVVAGVVNRALEEAGSLGMNPMRWNVIIISMGTSPKTPEAWIEAVMSGVRRIAEELPRVVSTSDSHTRLPILGLPPFSEMPPFGHTNKIFVTKADYDTWAQMFTRKIADWTIEEVVPGLGSDPSLMQRLGARIAALGETEESGPLHSDVHLLHSPDYPPEARSPGGIREILESAARAVGTGMQHAEDYAAALAETIPLGTLFQGLANRVQTAGGYLYVPPETPGEVVPLIQAVITYPFLEEVISDGTMKETDLGGRNGVLIVNEITYKAIEYLQDNPKAKYAFSVITNSADVEAVARQGGILHELLESERPGIFQKLRSDILLQDLGLLDMIRYPGLQGEDLPFMHQSYQMAVETWRFYVYGYLSGEQNRPWDLDYSSAIEGGWIAIKTLLKKTLVEEYPDVPDSEIDFFLEKSRDQLDSAIRRGVWVHRTARDQAWDPTGEQHISAVDDAKQPYMPRVYRGPQQIIFMNEELHNVVRFALADLVAEALDLAKGDLAESRPITDMIEEPGKFVVSESDVERVTASLPAQVRSRAQFLIHPTWPWATRVAAVERMVEKWKAEEQAGILSSGARIVGTHDLLEVPTGDGTTVQTLPQVVQSWEREKVTEINQWLVKELGPLVDAMPKAMSGYQTPSEADWAVAQQYFERVARILPGEPSIELLKENAISAFTEQTVQKWVDAFLEDTASGTGKAYGITHQAFDWKLAVPAEVHDKLDAWFNQARKQFLLENQRTLLPNLARQVYYQVPLTDMGQLVQLQYTALRLFSVQWQTYFTGFLQSSLPSGMVLKFQQDFGEGQVGTGAGGGGGRAWGDDGRIYPRLHMDTLWAEVVSVAWRSGATWEGVIRSIYNQCMHKRNDPLTADKLASDLTWEMRTIYEDKLSGYPNEGLTPAEYVSFVRGVYEATYKRGLEMLETRLASLQHGTAEPQFEVWATAIRDPSTPLTEVFRMFQEAELHSTAPGAREVLNLTEFFKYRTGLPGTPKEIAATFMGFSDRYRVAVRPGAGVGDVVDLLGQAYIERLYSTVDLVRRSGLWDLFDDTTKWAMGLVEIIRINGLVYPADPASARRALSGWEQMAMAANDRPELLPLLGLFRHIEPRIMETTPFGMDWFSTYYRANRTASSIQSAQQNFFRDAGGTLHSFEQAKRRIASLEQMISDKKWDQFEKLFKFYLIPFSIQEKTMNNDESWWRYWEGVWKGGYFTDERVRLWQMYEDAKTAYRTERGR